MEKTRNVKLSTELIDAIKKRAPDAAPGETLLAIYKEYEKLEALAKCTGTDATNPSVYDALKAYIDCWDKKFEAYQRSIDELKTMLQGLQLFFTKIKSP